MCILYYSITPLKFTAHSVHARKSETDNDQPTATVISGDNRSHSEWLDLELELRIVNGPEPPQQAAERDCPSPQSTTGISLKAEGSFASLCPFPVDIGVLLKSETLNSLDQPMKLRLITQTPDARCKYPTTT